MAMTWTRARHGRWPPFVLATALTVCLSACETGETGGDGGWSLVESVSNIDVGGEWNPREGRADQLRQAYALQREGKQEEALAVYRDLADAGYPVG